MIYLHIKEKDGMESHTKIYTTKSRHADGCSKLLDLLSRTDRDFFRQDPDRTCSKRKYI